MDIDKQVLREVYKRLRLEMTAAEVETKSRIIRQKLLEDVDWSATSTVCAFQPVTKLNEVDIQPLLRILQRHHASVYMLSQTKDTPVPSEKFDLILVPALAFDKDNYRLGWGSGFYDRFLAKQPQALKIGICFQNGFVSDDLPREPHDVPLDKVITEV